ncbi:MAG: hypothetical protein ACLQK4_11190 [Acidimicrobiales bacterium]
MVLSTDEVLPPTPGCPLEAYGAREKPLRPELGLIVNARGAYTPGVAAQTSECMQQAGLRLCVDPTDTQGILEVSVQLLGNLSKGHPVIDLGLSGSGLTDRTILDSFRAA